MADFASHSSTSPEASAVKNAPAESVENQTSPPAPSAGETGRRNVLTAFAAGAIGLVLALFPFAAGAMVFLDPVLRRKEEGEEGSGGGSGTPDQATPGQWIRVTNVGAVPADGTPVQFAVISDLKDAWNLQPNQPIGAVYLRRHSGEEEETSAGSAPKIEAFNAICPHAGCFVAYQEDTKTYLCPCHNSSFALDGDKIDKPGAFNPSPRPMDRLEVDEQRIASEGEVWVRFVNYYPGKHEQVPK